MGKIFFAGVLVLFTSLLSVGTPLYGQQWSFINFTPDNGLLASEIHGMFQDDLGYMWFSTDRGIARFDGTKFVAYNTTNGLPENCILNFFVQSPHKVWAYGVSHGIYTFDPLAKNIRFKKHPISESLRLIMQASTLSKAYIRNVYFLEDQSYVLTFLTAEGYIHIDAKGKITLHKIGLHTPFLMGDYNMVLEFQQHGKQKIPVNYFAPPDPGNKSLHDLIVHWPAGKTSGIATHTYNFAFQFGVADHFFDGDTVFVALGKYLLKISPGEMIFIELPGLLKLKMWNSQILAATFKGCYVLNHNLEIQQHMLTGYSVTNICSDHEGGLWLSTLEQGVFYHAPQHIKILAADNYNPTSATWIEKYNDHILVANENKTVSVFPANLKEPAVLLENVTHQGFYQAESSGLQKYLGSLISNNSKRHVYSYTTRSDTKGLIVDWVGNSVAINDTNGIRSFYLNVPRINDVTTVNDSVQILATVDGIYKVSRNLDNTWNINFLGGLKSVFNSVNMCNGVFLAGSEDAGIYIFKNNQLARFGIEQGLLSDQILDIEPSGDSSFWVATSGGINHVVFGKNGEYTTDMVTTHHGLISNEINELKVIHDTLWIAGKKGVCFFDQRTIAGIDEMNPAYFYIDSARINERQIALNIGQSLVLDYADNLDVYVTQVSFANGGGIRYKYRMSPGENWKWCDGNHVFINGLNYGDFQLEIQAVAGGSSHTSLWIPLTIKKPFWLQPEFYVLVLLILLLIGWAAYAVILKRVQKRRNDEHERVQLEIKSIISQMNPHFTFNTINSIQSYIINHGTRDAVLYLSDFATLIRKTLDYTRSGYITLEEELEFLHLYVELENKRFRNTFEFCEKRVLVTPLKEIKWPPLILQPLIENSIVHGLSNIIGGKIELQIHEEPNCFIIILTDNGTAPDVPPGKLKSSVGLEILRGRIRLHNGSDYVEQDLDYGPGRDGNTGWITTIKLYKKL